MDEYTQGCEMPNPGQSHMDVESNIGAKASSYQWNTGKPKPPLENQDGDADDDDLDMPDFAAMIVDFKGPKKDMIGYKDMPTIDADSKKYLYPGCKKKYSKLSATLALLRFKAANGLSNKGFTEMLGLFKEILPEDNVLPKSMNEAKKIVCPLELEVQKIHACVNDCILYRGEYKDLRACPTCKHA
jgi:hypothetical protein